MSKKTKSKSKAKKVAPAKKKAAKPVKKATTVQTVEKEVRKVEKEVAKEVRKIEKETVKVEKEIKKDAKKAKAVLERESPKTKPAPMNLGPAPNVTVSARHLDTMRDRPGRGFSFGELESAGIPLNAAKREGLRLDVRRRSVIEGNVAALKSWYQAPAAA